MDGEIAITVIATGFPANFQGSAKEVKATETKVKATATDIPDFLRRIKKRK